MTRDSGAQVGDTVMIHVKGVVTHLDDHDRVVMVQTADDKSGKGQYVPTDASVEVLERADDPKVGEIRREDHDGGRSIWQVEETEAGERHWRCTFSTATGNRGVTFELDRMLDLPVVGYLPGSPAAYAASTRPSVRVVNEPHGIPVDVRQKVADRLVAGDKAGAVRALRQGVGMGVRDAVAYVEGMSEYQSYLSEHGEKREQARPTTDADRAALRHRQELEAVKQGADETRRVQLAEALHAAQDLPWKDLLVEVRAVTQKAYGWRGPVADEEATP